MGVTKRCESCRFRDFPITDEPCYSCGIPNYKNWKPVVEHKEEPKNYTYYVVYYFVAQDGTTGIRGSLFDLDHKMDAVGVVMLQEMILKKNDFKEACILNWHWFE